MATSAPDELPEQFDLVHDGALFIETISGRQFFRFGKKNEHVMDIALAKAREIEGFHLRLFQTLTRQFL